MRRLNPKDIENWNSRLYDNRIHINMSNDRTLSFKYMRQIGSPHLPGGMREFQDISDSPKIYYKLIYSVSDQSLNRFESILEKRLKIGVEFKINKFNDSSKSRLPSNIHESLKISKYKIYERGYTQKSYTFSDINILDLIYFVTCIEDTERIISNYYQYSIDGTETCNIKYNLGNIISLESDRSGNYLVQDIIFDDNLTPLYEIAKIDGPINSNVLIFSDILKVLESSIIPNREYKLNSILEN